jgi:hypothetical protein
VSDFIGEYFTRKNTGGGMNLQPEQAAIRGGYEFQ